jgi:hypothetical protein
MFEKMLTDTFRHHFGNNIYTSVMTSGCPSRLHEHHDNWGNRDVECPEIRHDLIYWSSAVAERLRRVPHITIKQREEMIEDLMDIISLPVVRTVRKS